MFVSLLLSVLPHVSGCPDHISYPHQHNKRELSSADAPSVPTYWRYEASYNWGSLSPDYELCQTGTQQSPIALSVTQGLSQAHTPLFTGYDVANVSGDYYNWGYGPAFILDDPQGDYTGLPSVEVDGNKLYLTSWHIHAPADHSIGGDRSKAELHYVHYDSSGTPRAVFGIRLDPGREDSKWFADLPFPAVHFNSTSRYENVFIDPLQPIREVNNFTEFWTYKGSLTSPPCTEGIQWFVARNILYTSRAQMQEILRVSTYSARVEQEVWAHEVNV